MRSNVSRANTSVSSVDGVPAAGSCGSVVFVDRTGQELSSHDDHRQVDYDIGVVARGSLISPLVRPMIVVMRFIDGKDLAERAFAEDELLVQALSAQGANESLSERVRAGSSDRGFNDPSANGSEDRVEGSGELCVSVPDEELELASSLPKSSRRLRASWLTHGPVGFWVTPKMCTRRVATSRTKKT